MAYLLDSSELLVFLDFVRNLVFRRTLKNTTFQKLDVFSSSLRG
jgi:hypothetical protein